MQIKNEATQETSHNPVTEPAQTTSHPEIEPTKAFHVIKRNGQVVNFDGSKIKVAMTKAFLAVEGGNAAQSSRVHELVDQLFSDIFQAFSRRFPEGGTFHIEDIQDQVELALMRRGEHKVARSYVLYREQRRQLREAKERPAKPGEIRVQLQDGGMIPLDEA
ncbi:MAG: ribonucleoside-diphosphate reductase subunit alpha, partial [Gammaproteobacteria bacterium]|nr:ribonucleoside-diphosphate reductase subunit alpha [Gammaproteobacteria bacterium]